jgi:hypothetical protein
MEYHKLKDRKVRAMIFRKRRMGTGFVRGAAALVAVAALISGCNSDKGGPDAAWLSGEWSGSLSISYKSGGGAAGSLDLNLGQSEDFVSGIANWTPAKQTLSVAGPIDEGSLSLIVHFICTNSDENSPTTNITEGTLITGIATGDTVTFTGASGTACPDGGLGIEVAGASGSVTRSSNKAPLGTGTTPPSETDNAPL